MDDTTTTTRNVIFHSSKSEENIYVRCVNWAHLRTRYEMNCTEKEVKLSKWRHIMVVMRTSLTDYWTDAMHVQYICKCASERLTFFVMLFCAKTTRIAHKIIKRKMWKLNMCFGFGFSSIHWLAFQTIASIAVMSCTWL